jgi:hypothetical protein
MDLQTNEKILGVPEYLYYGQNERVDELNARIKGRQFPDSPLEPNFSPRPVPTKYSHFPIINRRKPMNEPVIPYLEHNTNINFNPGTHRAPPSGFLNNVDVETVLRNQTVALQNSGQGVYIPSANSDLYNVRVVSRPSEQTHPLLFERPHFDGRLHPNVAGSDIGREQFFNHTRTQLRKIQQ